MKVLAGARDINKLRLEFPSQGRNKILNPNWPFSLASQPFNPNYGRLAVAREKWQFYNTET
jgi:hypothetical protein